MDASHERIPGSHLANPIWNPSAAANWSILFTPVFGSYLHEQNWRALGEPILAAQARKWLFASIAFILCTVVAQMLLPPTEAVDTSVKVIWLLYLILWYFVSAKPQAKYVKQRYGETYPHRRWGRPVLVAAGVLIAWLVSTFLLASLFYSAGGET